MPTLDAHPRVVGVPAVHRLAVLLGHHLQRELVVVAQEHAPAGALGDVRGLGEHPHELVRLLRPQRVEDARHDREVEGHVALRLLLGAEEGGDLARPLVRLGDQDAARVVPVDHRAHPLDELVGRRLALAVALLGLVEVGDGIEPEPVDAQVDPEPDDLEDVLVHGRVLEVEVGLVGEEAVEVELAAHRSRTPSWTPRCRRR